MAALLASRSLELALAFCPFDGAADSCLSSAPGPRHWAIMVDLIERSDVRGAMVS
jgi:hypothetical protein